MVVQVPYMFVGGELDFCVGMYQKLYDMMPKVVPHLMGRHLIAGAGHWVQQEKPEEVNRLLIKFLDATASNRQQEPAHSKL